MGSRSCSPSPRSRAAAHLAILALVYGRSRDRGVVVGGRELVSDLSRVVPPLETLMGKVIEPSLASRRKAAYGYPNLRVRREGWACAVEDPPEVGLESLFPR